MGSWDALLRRHRPELRFDSHEIYFADAADSWTDNPTNVLKRGDNTLGAVEPQPGSGQLPLSLGLLRRDFYGGDRRHPVSSGDYIANTSDDHARQATLFHQRVGYRNRMYGRVQGSQRDAKVVWLQYWFFYFYNSYEVAGYGRHEGDWEMIQLRLDEQKTPDLAVYAQHRLAGQLPWSDVEKVDDDNRRPVVYVALGSHASYFTPGRHDAPVGHDHADGKRRMPDTALVIVDDRSAPWTRWPGTWGGTQPEDPDDPATQPSPQAPCMHAQWEDPEALLGAAKSPVLAPRRLAPPAPSLAIVRAGGGNLRVEYGFPSPAADASAPQTLLVTVNCLDDGAPPKRFSRPALVEGGSALLDAGLRRNKGYDVYVSAVSPDGVQSESVGLLLEPVADVYDAELRSAGADVSDVVGLVRGAVGGAAAFALIVYLTGAIVLALRLIFADLPALGVVGQIPRDVLISLGAAEIVLPALGFASLHLIYRGTIGMQQPRDRPRPWYLAAHSRVARCRHVLFVASVPVLLVVPGATLSIIEDDGAPDYYAGILLAVTVSATGVGWWQFCKWRSNQPHDALQTGSWEHGADGRNPSTWRENALVAAGLGLTLAAGALVTWTSDAGPEFLAFGAAWCVCFAFVMAYGFARGRLAESFRSDPREVRGQIAMSSLVTLLAVPALIVFWSAWELPAASVHLKDPDTLRSGSLIGESKEQVFLGRAGTITSVPMDNVSHVEIGD